MNKKIREIIPIAYNVINNNANKIDKNVKSHINAFGPSIVQIGLLNTIILYKNQDSEAYASRKIFLEILIEILKNVYAEKYNESTLKDILSTNCKKNSQDYEKTDLIDFDKNYKQAIINCYLAIKDISKLFCNDNSEKKELMKMENDNLSFIFYKKYESFDEKYFLNFNYTNNNKDLDNNLYNYWLEMETDYPGLLIGSGYTTNNSDIKLSFDFDYLTGDPIIRGSSIKGILRELFDKIKVQPTESNDTISENISNYLINTLNLPSEILNSITSKEEFLIYLKYYIFEGKIFNETTSEFDYIPIKKDINFLILIYPILKLKKYLNMII
ncbi:RAMP superfamily CRISPR-associated protein [Oceanotoga sp. DSM 15011]|uniref:RAMP superfamily CRISPR-associated protein n=1 Tax=Oceanotoga sp. DSM 15011 TaxID=2984951 RepID=UPI0021F4588F|nr:RAMP superfamily CRISPR-associated protein [Oceanotoga sp. DSM 15011]UYP01344.1 RAMP superfamily CRISPR-associated protein [Oceanotoga sp. DSM 15011]